MMMRVSSPRGQPGYHQEWDTRCTPVGQPTPRLQQPQRTAKNRREPNLDAPGPRALPMLRQIHDTGAKLRR